MTSSLATNSNIFNRAPGIKKYLQADPNNEMYPYEGQVPMTISSTTNATGTHADLVSGSNVWIINDDMSAGSTTYTLTQSGFNNMIGRRTTIVFNGTVDVANHVTLTLPAGVFWIATGLATGNVTAEFPPNVAVVCDVVWTHAGPVITTDVSGFSFS